MSNFRDIDIVGVRPIVAETSGVFQRFWEGPWSVPVSKLVGRFYSPDNHDKAISDIRCQIKTDNYAFPLEIDTRELVDRLETILDDLIWAPGEIVWEDPASIYDGIKPGSMNQALHDRFLALDSELLIESAYFVPGKDGIAATRSLRERVVD